MTAWSGQESRVAFPDWEIGTCGIGVAVSGGQGACQQVQAASEAVNDGPGLGIDNGVQPFNVGEAIKLFSGLRIGIYRHGIGPILPPSTNTFYKNWDLGYGPIDCSFSV